MGRRSLCLVSVIMLRELSGNAAALSLAPFGCQLAELKPVSSGEDVCLYQRLETQNTYTFGTSILFSYIIFCFPSFTLVLIAVLSLHLDSVLSLSRRTDVLRVRKIPPE